LNNPGLFNTIIRVQLEFLSIPEDEIWDGECCRILSAARSAIAD
jgi:hypothetical protein